jgi:DNA modification methylase
VLDPFAGSGTTGQVAYELGCKAVLIESSDMGRDAMADRVSRLNGRLF